MALTRLHENKSSHDKMDFLHSEHNVSPFGNPLHSQFGVKANATGPVQEELVVPVRPPDSDKGTARELRSRRPNLRGAHSRSTSEPPAREPWTLRLPSWPGKSSGQSLPSPAPPGEPSIPAPEHDIDVDDIDWNDAKLDALNGEVDELAHKMLSLD